MSVFWLGEGWSCHLRVPVARIRMTGTQASGLRLLICSSPQPSLEPSVFAVGHLLLTPQLFRLFAIVPLCRQHWSNAIFRRCYRKNIEVILVSWTPAMEKHCSPLAVSPCFPCGSDGSGGRGELGRNRGPCRPLRREARWPAGGGAGERALERVQAPWLSASVSWAPGLSDDPLHRELLVYQRKRPVAGAK